MVILILERAPRSLRGELSRWFIEPRAGVFVGRVSAMVRDKLWEKVLETAPESGAIMIHSAQTEQGFQTRLYGDTSRSLVDFEGLTLVRVPVPDSRAEKPRSSKKSSEKSDSAGIV
jgi:CRISPR-associated protein Cas2